MRNQVSFLALALCAGSAVGLLLVRGEAGGDKDPWKPILSKENYQELVKREADLVRELLAGKPNDASIRRARIGAVFIAGFAKSAAGSGEESGTTVPTALYLAAL